MREVTGAEVADLRRSIRRSWEHMETRDSYGTAEELPYLAQWQQTGDTSWLADWPAMNDWCDMLRSHVAEGLQLRRARIVSEPLSVYQRWSFQVAPPMVDAGEDIRWCSRRLVSAIGLPGNDFYVLDGEVALFLHYEGDGKLAGYTATEEQPVLGLCQQAFEAVWSLSTPHREYQPK